MEVKGQEKAAFTRYWQESRQRDDGTTEFHERSERLKYKHKFAYVKVPVFQVPGGFLQPGSYAVSF
jgi:hypothetical protein